MRGGYLGKLNMISVTFLVSIKGPTTIFSHKPFYSALTAKELGIKQIGSFKCLNGKVDLSTHEAQHTLDEWISHLNTLRDELSVRTIAKEISASRRPYTVKVLAYRNGQGRAKPGEVIVGSSVPGVSDVVMICV